ncbi:ComEC/Rec2 family competence protein [Sphingobacterium sp. SGR-19]|uniref:ComEC/Rec2 family competence protein n=1 Tax=Sphingobacterium sp. SGR-19 TaxID=2710886 RepID=UPI0013EB7D76|nr:ComEC/Rec2 family competence protein [Sphingobacterium sp. SGR-19]NGM64803.1 ComEC family competence protein [Sphingobacterium sp. SGR-19]
MVGQACYLAVRKVPSARFFLFFGIGIVCGYYIALPTWLFQVVIGCIIAILLLLIGIEIYSRRWRRVFFPWLFYTQLFLLGIVWIGRALPAHQSRHFVDKEAEYLIGVVIDEPVYREGSIRFPLEIRHIVYGEKVSPATGQIMLTIVRKKNVSDLTLSYGDKLFFRNEVTEVRAPHNPKQFDYKRYLAHKNIYHQAYIQPADVRLIGSGEGNNMVARALAVRQYFVRKFEQFIIDREALEVCSALILGHRANFQAEILAAFINTGTVHVLSVSGLHVGMVFFLLNFLLGFLNRFPHGRPIRFVLILISIWGYVLLTGMAPSILRAGVMISFLLVAGWSQRSNQKLNSLFASACCLLLLDPFMIFDMGFQLSYLAVLGLFTLYPLLNRAFPIKNRWIRIIWQAVLVSSSAQLFTTPFALYYFHQFPNYFLLGNLFVTVPATVLMYGGIVLAVCPFLAVNNYLGIGLSHLSRFLLGGLKAIESLPFATTQGIDLSTWQLFLFLSVIVFVLITWYGLSKPFLWCTLVSLGILVFSTVVTSIRYTSYQGIKIYNVGREVAIAVINCGKVSVISTLDSLQHPRLMTQVLPDLHHYVRTGDIAFHQLPELKRGQHMKIHTAMGTLGVVESRIEKKPVACDILLWRNMSPYDTLEHKDFSNIKLLILDGSNRASILPEMIKNADALGLSYYVLKNNFAYVWNKKHGK